MDWRNLKNDRARAAYDNFVPLDGQFEDNAILQIKHGPIDFQVREPASPLFGALEKTNQAIELQITQEYFGQAAASRLPGADVEGSARLRPAGARARNPGEGAGGGEDVSQAHGGIRRRVQRRAANANWLGHDLSQANLYGFGRLAWNPDLSARPDCGGMDAPDLRPRSAGRRD